MARSVDKDILIGFIDEVKSYLPLICQGINTIQADPAQIQYGCLTDAHRYVHTIKGAASMIGFANLSHIANCLEDTIEEITDGSLPVTDSVLHFLNNTVAQIEVYLDQIFIGGSDEHILLEQVNKEMRSLHNPSGAPLKEVETVAPAPQRSAGRAEGRPQAPAAETAAEPAEKSKTDAVTQELMEIFLVEAEDHLHTINSALRTLENQPGRKEVMEEIRRSVHTLKGAGAMVGFRSVTQLSHRMEDLLDLLYAGSLVVTLEILDLLFSSQDCLQDLLNGTIDLPLLDTLYARYAVLIEKAGAVPGESGAAEFAGPSAAAQPQAAAESLEPGFTIDQNQQKDTRKFAEEAGGQAEEKPAGTTKRSSQVVRVPLERLDELVRMVSELAISRTTLEKLLLDYRRLVDEMIPSVERLRVVSNNIQSQYEVSSLESRWIIGGPGGTQKPGAGNYPYGFDSLEFDRYTEFHRLSRELIETTSDIRTVGNELNTLTGDFDAVLNRQGRISSEIQDRLMQARMVPLATLSTRLYRTVRVLAHEQGKKVDFIIEGEQIQLDKTVLEEVADPLIHLLRNSVDHGIEPPELRQVLGKSENGQIRLHAYYEGNQVVIEVHDDGAGLESQILRATAVRKGYLTETEAGQLSDQELMSLIFMPGFSTSAEISEVSGRGVGLDVVRNNVQKLKGSVSVASKPGKGMTFVIRLPMTMAITRALLVKANGETFAFPLNVVTQILRLSRDQFELIGKETVVRVNGVVYPVIRLGDVLHLKQPADESIQRVPVLIFNAGDKQLALVIDRILSGREIVIKSLGSHLRQVHGIAGATLMGDGSVVLILNPLDLVASTEISEQKFHKPTPILKSSVHESFNVMIVDDSPSVRRVLSNLMKNTGWTSVTAKDGVDALETLQRSANMPDLMILDIEMPRMNGYELIQTLKSTPEFSTIPVIFLTSRAGEKHQRKAMELGATDYVVKPYQDEVLLSIIRKHVLAARSVMKE
jgi:chemosensory pili system protein ChpA (sensor histidine kinase/response regulator)